MLKKIKSFPISVKATQILFILAIVVYFVMVLIDVNQTTHVVAMVAFFLGMIAAAVSITKYKTGSWPLGIIDFILAVGTYIHYLNMAK